MLNPSQNPPNYVQRRNEGDPFSNFVQLSQTIADILRTALQHVMVLQNLARASFSIKRQLLQNDLSRLS